MFLEVHYCKDNMEVTTDLPPVVAAVLLLLILTDWELTFKPSQEAHAHEALLAIMYFDDMTESADQSRFGEPNRSIRTR